jgi:hypothetical protein
MSPFRKATLLYDGPKEHQALFYDEDIQLRGSDNPLWHDDWGLYDEDPLFQTENTPYLQDYTYKPIIKRQQFSRKEKAPEQCSGNMCAAIFLAACVIAGWMISHPNVNSPIDLRCQASLNNQTFPELLATVSTQLSFCDQEVGDKRR